MENKASCCISLSVSEVEVCKLPLLDGEISASVEIITTEVPLKNAGNLLDVCRNDRIQFSGTVCTAWALLLRCYTGQDQVTFEYTTNYANTTASLLRMSFTEDDILSKYTDRARDAFTGIAQERLAVTELGTATVNHATVSSLVNTAVCICDSDKPPGMLTAKIAERFIEVSG